MRLGDASRVAQMLEFQPSLPDVSKNGTGKVWAPNSILPWGEVLFFFY